ncbi:MAG: hypothetical protein V1708_02525 [Candidatus Micrarchaeota archaeon]
MPSYLLEGMRKLKKAISRKDIASLKEFGEEVAEKAFLEDKPPMLGLAVIAYSVAKFEEKPYIVKGALWPKVYAEILDHLDECIRTLSDEQEDTAYDLLADMVDDLEEFSYASSRFRSTVIEKAKIKAATQVYAHGASLSVASEFAGVPKEELAKYIGATRLPEKYETFSVKERLKSARELFT